MATTYKLTAEVRDGKGTGASRRLRRAGKVPAVLYGGGEAPAQLALDHNQLMHSLELESFHSSILEVDTGSGPAQAILRDVQRHPVRPLILHVDLQRVRATDKIHIKVPIHFVNEATAPGVKTQGGLVSHLMTDVDISCLPSQLPEFLQLDLGQMNVGDSLHLSDIPLPEGVEITSLGHGGEDLAVVTVSHVRTAAVEEEAAVEGAEAAATPAAGTEAD